MYPEPVVTEVSMVEITAANVTAVAERLGCTESDCNKPPRAVAGLNAFLADVEDRCIIQRAPVPHDFSRTPLPASPVEGLGELVDALAENPAIESLAQELLDAGLMWICEGCGGAAVFADGVCSCGTKRSDTASHESA